MKVSSRLSIGFGLLIVALILVSATAIFRLITLNEEIGELVKNRMVKVQQFTEIKDNLNAIARINRNVALISDVKDAAIEADKIPPLQAKNAAILDALAKTITQPKAQELLKRINEVRPTYNQRLAESIKMGLTGKPEDAQAATAIIVGDLRDKQSILFKAVDDSLALQQALAKDVGDKANEAVASSSVLVSIIAGVATVLGLFLAWAISRAITRQLGAEPSELSEVVGRVANGDLTSHLQLQRGDTSSVMAAIDRMQQSLITVVTNVRQGSELVASASTQIAQGNMDLSGRTESQASALEETAASMEEMSSTVKQNADNARQANQLAQSASGVAVQGGQVVSQVIDTMKDISDSSKKISDIISVIDGIAFQTNILALNAAVEAARAGEQGRGFAVVATEVRSLAGRSAEAAKQIKHLINDSVERVEQGTVLVDKAGSTMNEVVNSIQRVTDIMAEISSASVEQSAGVTQVGEAVTQMDENTQQNAALVEEMAAAANALNSQAADLVRTVAVFKLNQHNSTSARAVASLSPVAPITALSRPVAKLASKSPPSRPKKTVANGESIDDSAEWETF
ncbi:MCP four helix bundle domain-containing protein [Duganella sp. FT3S]|uniref:MCP four helix bundle domain-containing protein n=2 Tax=Rugamonas fusca TaxID=2758568 RepID=A0A7W2EMS6_9BURK|nr:MCP four helix bundle domain-containing protein [Rugamonas fusca]